MVLHEKKLKSILDKVPEGMKVGIVSVVGAFRMGKSFLLDCMLHYLHYMADDEEAEWYGKDDESDKERSYLEEVPRYEAAPVFPGDRVLRDRPLESGCG